MVIEHKINHKLYVPFRMHARLLDFNYLLMQENIYCTVFTRTLGGILCRNVAPYFTYACNERGSKVEIQFRRFFFSL